MTLQIRTVERKTSAGVHKARRNSALPEPEMPSRSFVVLLIGGPYDGQDIVVTIEEWINGTLLRHKRKYIAKGPLPSSKSGSGQLREYHFLETD